MDNILSYLLEHGGCSIRYRVRREIMGEPPTSGELLSLQKQIMEKPKVRKIAASRQADGWIGSELHGAPGKGLDSSVSFLLNYGVETDAPLLKDVVNILLAGHHSQIEDLPYRTTFKGGEALDAGGRGGNNTIRAGILAELGEEKNPLVQNELKISLEYLRDSLTYNTIDDFSLVNKKNIRYYKPDAHFPGSNHLYLLAQTTGWRTEKNIELFKTSFEHCYKIMEGHSHNIMFKAKSHFVGPFNFKWSFHDFTMDDIYQDSYAFVWWLRNLSKLSKLGIIHQIPTLKTAYDYLYQLVLNHDIVNKQNETSLNRFKEILSTEDNWRKKESIFCDIMFSGVIVLYYAGYL